MNRNFNIGGVVLILLGVLFLLDNLVPGFDFGDWWPPDTHRDWRFHFRSRALPLRYGVPVWTGLHLRTGLQMRLQR